MPATLEGLDAKDLLGALRNLRDGNFTARLPRDLGGVAGEIAEAFNELADNADRMRDELSRIRVAVGREGKVRQRAAMPGARGSWASEIDSINGLIADLVQPSVDVGRVLAAVARGDLSQKMALETDEGPLKGEFRRTSAIVNGMVDQLASFASEVIRVTREVGTEGDLGGQAKVEGVSGMWKDLTDGVNLMASNLTGQVRNIAEVTTAVANGDLSRKITVDVRGEILELKATINTMVDQLRSFAAEVTRVAREVGTEGKLGGQARVEGVSGTWRDLTDSVNYMAGNLTAQVRDVAQVAKAVAQGDLSRKIAVDVKGEILDLKNTINTMVDQLGSFASEVTRVAREVGTEGKLGGQAKVKGVSGTWKDLTDSVNFMAGNLTAQMRNIAEVTTAVAKGDLGKKITVDVKGEILALKNTINTMVDQLGVFAAEVTRVAREVGGEGRLGGQAKVEGVSGTWSDLTDSVNYMAGNLTAQVRDIAQVAKAVARGDLSRKITVDVRGEILELKNTLNTMVDQLSSFASEVTRVAREVGTEGKLGGQAKVEGVSGTWADLTESVNHMAGNLTGQVRDIAQVTTAVANGDLSTKITVDVKGEILELKDTINKMVDQLRSFASEVTRVAREVGNEGKLGGQAQVRGVSGTWRDLTDSVNQMAGNLTGQVRDIAQVAKAVAAGDLSTKITVDVRGEILELKNTLNTMVDQLRSFASEVTRVAREVGSEGKLGGQADVRGVSGTWRDLTDSVNLMAGNLTGQVRNIAEVTTAVANGDLSRKITVDVRGEILELKDTFNRMVDQLRSFAAEVTRVAREVGTEGKLGGQAKVEGVSGTWMDLTDSVNYMAGNLTGQVRDIAQVAKAVAAGDLSRKITVDVKGEIQELKDTLNTMVDQLRSFASEVTRVAREVGTEGRLGGQAKVEGVSGTWRDLTDSVNFMASNLTSQVRNIAQVTTAVANGDLSRKITVDVKGEILELKDTINTMVDQLGSFASEVTRVAREVGTEGKLGGQAQVKGVAGIWKELTDNVNFMAGNLTDQVRGIAKVVTAVANGNLKPKLTVEAKGEIAALADTINGMTDTLATFADQVIVVAREVGVEGKLGGQARVPGAAGTWRDLTENVNLLAANWTTQVRAIAEVATAVTKGDLTRSIKVEALGEVAVLKDTINEMIRNLKDTTRRNTDQDWLKTNLAKFTRMLQGQRDLAAVARMILSEVAPVIQAQHGVFYLAFPDEGGETVLRLQASYAFKERKHLAKEFRIGEGLVGQCAFEGQRILVTEAPPDYIQIASGLGAAPPLNIVVLPILFENEVKAVVELASFNRFSEVNLTFLDQLAESIGIVLNTIAASMRTEALLKQSQLQGNELQTQQEELQRTNLRLADQAASLRTSEELLKRQQEELRRTNEDLQDKARLLEGKNREVEFARKDLEDKAEQLELTSRYKSQFLASMSHELRTPLNSLLILAKLLQDNPEQHLSEREVEYARTIHASGTDLLGLINEILDLSKIEAGKVEPEISEVVLREVADDMERAFKQVAAERGLSFDIDLAPGLPFSIRTDPRRLVQVLRNLLSNAFKFTEKGGVTLSATLATGGWSREHDILNRAGAVVAFRVTDTGIGIPPDKQKIVFEAFQQLESGMARRYGGTGLGLSISREITRLLGGEIALESTPGEGSTFTLFLPATFMGPLSGPLGGLKAAAPGSRPGAVTFGPSATTAPAAAQATEQPADTGLARLEPVEDDRETLREGDRVLLIVEDDPRFGSIVLELARSQGFRGILARTGDAALQLAEKYRPDGITLDLLLPGLDGWTVLDRLKHNPRTRAIPVQIVSVLGDRARGLRMGALAFIEKPVERDALARALARLAEFRAKAARDVMAITPREETRLQLAEILAGPDVAITWQAFGEGALAALRGREFDLVVVDSELPDIPAAYLVEAVRKDLGLADTPILVYARAALDPASAADLRRHATRVVAARPGASEELLALTAIYLHRRDEDVPESQRALLRVLERQDPALAGRRVLVVDDDVRNLFAITSLLERYHIEVVPAHNGREALEKLEGGPRVDAALMDLMMPGLDGYEATRAIRAMPEYVELPVIALTAKAMRGERDRCLEAGMSDYVAKPVEEEQLVSMLRVWLARDAVEASRA